MDSNAKFKAWYEKSTSFTPSQQKATAARRKFHRACSSDPETDRINGIIAVTIIQVFTDYNTASSNGPTQCGGRRIVRDRVEDANAEARAWICEEIDEGEDSAQVWDEVFGSNDEVRARAVFQDAAKNARAIAWVEEMDAEAS
ncbi:hypothetical protein BDV06DRAFT_67779 [Aspergillus oleicola]